MLETPNLVLTFRAPYKHFWREKKLVRLELVPVLNGLTLNWTFTYSLTISALGLVMSVFLLTIFLLWYWSAYHLFFYQYFMSVCLLPYLLCICLLFKFACTIYPFISAGLLTIRSFISGFLPNISPFVSILLFYICFSTYLLLLNMKPNAVTLSHRNNLEI